ncbi:TPA_asm: beta-ketoacyl-[acyl-carrier-protein] synthase family protein [Salmonella enterica subsp. houtenae serovar 16:z4,z32:-]|uniref:Beta-ketoacyl-[acyl-carrier-protein] synthase family protein n=1 Tax=Salmonella enterica subsp. houtenae serovar 16:z4,z32:- TaxID=1307497 RepID=A0A735P3Z6_SALHO|nr:beta-ketoacyl-[acyl-carrier-protein] synthase family protein [Salmonella enterica]EDQ6563765.1 beta-ketoacyl-[acyl-carrier-protein] synthase family protein [Salmonella enterica subsp. houtenae]EDS7538178.1 beta-ketoacyl-[acyl-carrier-protein] synthase family protein [Salmonella enterica subsp. enterica]EGI6408835.1 beta-ketoacyl-[acyl-carrier-protein] synthase family protein [Salmonella enterica subsp. houtenae serovar 16:z4,z32:-]ENZ84216.1 3-oxoacyl-[acyl-carrier-protein] synthase [Salmone
MKTQYRRVVITGQGAITSLGQSVNECWQAIMDYRLGYKHRSLECAGIKSTFYGEIEDEPSIRFVPPGIRRRLPRFARLAMFAAKEAIEQSYGDRAIKDYYDPCRCGVIIGTGWAGQDESIQNHDQYRDTGLGSTFGCIFSMPNVATAACSQFWNLRGYQNTPIAACATGTIAIGDAFEAIRSGRADMMLAGSGESLRSHTSIWNIDVLRALTREQDDITKACCPFSKDRNGFVLSEGAAVLCLEERESAIARGATILGEITGYGNFSDATDFTAPAEDKIARVKTIDYALRQAGIEASMLDYINAHGTSTPLNDKNECEAIKTALGEAAFSIPVSSTKSYSGHLIAAAGSFETIICLQAMHHHRVPATHHLYNPDPDCDLDFVAQGHRQVDIHHALNLSFGFGGANAALVISRGEA